MSLLINPIGIVRVKALILPDSIVAVAGLILLLLLILLTGLVGSQELLCVACANHTVLLALALQSESGLLIQ